MKTGKYLKFYNDCIETGEIPGRGLCNCITASKIKIFHPTKADIETLSREGSSLSYWGSGLRGGKNKYYLFPHPMCSGFTDLRQNIVLFLAAMNGEL